MKVVIPQLVYDKVMHWIDKTTIEVSGFGTVIYDKDKQEFHVTDAYLLKQEGGAAHTDIDPTALGELLFDTMRSGQELKWWWHSHVKMGVFWSSQDTTTIKEMGQHGWLVATVFNQLREMKSAVCYKTTSDFGSLIHTNDHIPTEIVRPSVTPEIIAQWDKEFTDKVFEKKYTPPSYLGYSHYQAWDEDYYERWQARKAQEEKETQTLLGLDEDPGLLGYGVKKEAKVLNMDPATYASTLDQPKASGIRQGYIQRLTKAEYAGELR